MKALLAIAGLMLLTACSSPYQQALESPTLTRPEPPTTMADARARQPYDQSPHFRAAK